MGIFNNLFENFFEKDPTGQKALKKQRDEVKIRFKARLKEELFMTDEEAQLVISVIEEHEKKRDKVQENFNPYGDSTEESNIMVKKLELLQEEMEAEVIEVINTIMREKVKLAKEMKKRQEGNS